MNNLGLGIDEMYAKYACDVAINASSGGAGISMAQQCQGQAVKEATLGEEIDRAINRFMGEVERLQTLKAKFASIKDLPANELRRMLSF